MLLTGTHKVWMIEVEAVTGTPDDPRYTLVSIQPGVVWRQENMKPRARSTGAQIITAGPGDLGFAYDRNGQIRVFLWEGIPFDPCEGG